MVKELKDLKLPVDIHCLLRIESAKRKLNLYKTIERLIYENQELIHENQELKLIVKENRSELF